MKAKLVFEFSCCATCLAHRDWGDGPVCLAVKDTNFRGDKRPRAFQYGFDCYRNKPEWCPIEPVQERRSKEEIEAMLKEVERTSHLFNV